MATYPEGLNQDAQTIKTPAVYDSDVKQWVMLSQLLLRNSAGQLSKAQLDAFNRFAATIYALDGDIDSLGARADAAELDPAKAATVISILKGLLRQSIGLGKDATLQDIQMALGTLNEKDFATEATLAQVLAELGGLSAAATEETLEAIKTALTDGKLKAQVIANLDTLRPPVVGRRTATATAAELFAGASRLANRRRLVIRNEDPALRCLIGPATVSQQTGFPIEPGAVLDIPCDPDVTVPVYAISEGASLTVAVMEI